MIRKAILTTILLFLLYTVFVSRFAPKWWAASQHQWQDNMIKAQKFVYDDTAKFKNVIVGSSLSCRLIMDSLPHTYNLSFAGQGIFDGLNILTHKSNLPGNVFIEMNVVLRLGSKDFTNSLFSPVLYYPRKALLSLREDEQPIAALGVMSMAAIGKIKKHSPAQQPGKSESTENKTGNDSSLFAKTLAIQIKDYSQLPTEETLTRSFTMLQQYVDKLEQKGVHIIFFEMPVNSQLENLPKATMVRSTFYRYFPVSKYQYTPFPDTLKCETTDGLHLKPDEALKYTIFFKSANSGYFH